MSALSTQRVLSVHHWNDDLFSFRTTRIVRCASSMDSS